MIELGTKPPVDEGLYITQIYRHFRVLHFPSQSASLTALPEGEPRHLRHFPSSVSFGATFPTGGKARDVISSIIRFAPINFTCPASSLLSSRRDLHFPKCLPALKYFTTYTDTNSEHH